jgi:hypothetical protein
MTSRRIAVIAILSALSVGTNYALLSFFNVKFMDLIVFVSGFCFGPVVGASIGIVSWAIYGTLNPLGFSLPIWLSTMFSETIYGIGGGFVRRFLVLNDLGEFKNDRINIYALFGTFGMFLTFLYDFITNVVFGYVNGLDAFFAVVIGFVPFGLVHVLSNALFFSLGCAPAISVVLRFVGGENVCLKRVGG